MNPQTKTRIIWALRVIMPIVGIVIFLSFVPLNLVLLWISPVADTVQAEADNAIAQGLDGIIVYVDHDGQEAAWYAAGLNNRAEQSPADAHALFKIASISKLYIAAAAAKLAADGRLPLDSTVTDYFPELAERIENAEQITVRMLLQHRSGIPNFVDDPDYRWFETLPNRDAYLAYALDKPADFAPDSDYRYSNTNYLLIGNILDRVLGYSHHDYIRDEIVGPLGLTHTFNLSSEVDLDTLTSGYHDGVEADLKELDHTSPGGSMIATAEDVGIFLRALNDGSLFTDEERAIYASLYRYEHTGWVPGYQSIARYFADDDLVVVQFVNSTGGYSEMFAPVVYDRIVRAARG
jgi:CubicO group peptidase (beta-lactamase class C family)